MYSEEKNYRPLPLENVTFTEGFWKRYTENTARITIPYCLNRCIDSGCKYNFELAAGINKGNYIGDNTWLDSDIYKVIEAACYSMQKYPNDSLLKEINTLVEIISLAQEKDGYLYTPRTTKANNPRVKKFMGDYRWTNMGHFSHELYNMGHMIEAAVAHYELTHERTFLDVAIKAADLIVKTFNKNGLAYPPGHQEIEMALIRLYDITNERKYVETADFLLKCRGVYKNRNSYTDEFFKEYHQDHCPVFSQYEAVGHAVRAVYMYSAMADLLGLNFLEYKEVLDSIWNDVVYTKMYLTSGIGNQELGESFGAPFQLDNLHAYTETCAAIGMSFWAKRMFTYEQKSDYYDVIERASYNGILSGISLDGKHFFYKNPLESDGKKLRTEWNSCACCPPNISRYIASIGGLFYGIKGEKVYINMYGSSKAKINLLNSELLLQQETEYPIDGLIKISLNLVSPKQFSILLRIPGWVYGKVLPSDLYSVFNKNNSTSFKIKVNDKEVRYNISKGYVDIDRIWNNNDVITIEFPMGIQYVYSSKIPQDHGSCAINRGPLLYCVESIDNNWNNLNISLNECEFYEHLEFVNDLKSLKLKSSSGLSLIPYFMWCNRFKGKMKVWIPFTNNK